MHKSQPPQTVADYPSRQSRGDQRGQRVEKPVWDVHRVEHPAPTLDSRLANEPACLPPCRSCRVAGGVTALGANVLNMAVIGPLLGYSIYAKTATAAANDRPPTIVRVVRAIPPVSPSGS